MSANPKFLAATAHVDEAAVQPLPNSRKVYVPGSRPDLRVPMREIRQADTPTMFGGEANPPIYVYDCSGPYTEPEAKIDIRSADVSPVKALPSIGRNIQSTAQTANITAMTMNVRSARSRLRSGRPLGGGSTSARCQMPSHVRCTRR